MRRLLFACIVILLSAAASFAQTTNPTPFPTPAGTPAPIDLLAPEVVNVYPHDSGAFTQGLLLHDGSLYESAGQYGESDVREVEIESGDVQHQTDVPETYFAEGLALVDDRLIQLTWREGAAFVYDLDTLEQVHTFSYEGEGWGLCYDGESLWMSDGTEKLAQRDPETFEPVGEIVVTYQGYPVSLVVTAGGRVLSALNELECVGDSIYANVWFTDYILVIDKTDGQVTGVIDASGLLTPAERAALPGGAVLNGIAYNPEADTFYLTGKLWPKLFEVRFEVVTTLQ